MSRHQHTGVAYAAVAVALLLGSSRAWSQLADTPWPTMNRDVQRTGCSPSIGPDEPTLKWRFEMEQHSFAGIAIGSDGTIYTGDNAGLVYAVDPDGTERWRYQTTSDLIWSAGPTIAADGTIYIGTQGTGGGSTSSLHALNPDGTSKWIFPLGYHLYGSPVIDDEGIVYIGTREAFIRAIAPDGTAVWTFGARGETYYFAACPALGHDGRLYTPTTLVDDHHLYCLDRDGNQVWRTPGYSSYSGAAIDEQGMSYIANYYSPGLIKTRPDGTVAWTQAIGSSISLPCIGYDGTIHVGGSNRFWAFAPGGTVLWTYPGYFYWCRPVVDAAGTVYVATDDGYTNALRNDGTLKWSLYTGGARTQYAIDHDGTLYAAADGLYAIGPGTPPPCPGDLDESGAVDFADLLGLLSAWGPCPHHAGCPEDLDDSGIVDFADILILLAAWGPCS